MNPRRIFVRQIQQITLRDPLPRQLAPIGLFRARRFGLLGSLLGVLTFTCAGVSAADTVRVTNPATEPVLTSRVDEPARVPYQAQLVGATVTCDGGAFGTISCSGSISGAPAGKRLVVQQVSGRLIANSPSSPTKAQIVLETQSPAAIYFAVPSISSVANVFAGVFHGYASVFQSQQTVYIDGGSPVFITITLLGSTSVFNDSITVTGYIVDCTANAPCMPIVTH
jgi:hypothetical protein